MAAAAQISIHDMASPSAAGYSQISKITSQDTSQVTLFILSVSISIAKQPGRSQPALNNRNSLVCEQPLALLLQRGLRTAGSYAQAAWVAAVWGEQFREEPGGSPACGQESVFH